MFEIIDKEVITLEKEGHSLIKIEQAKNKNYLILYSPSHDKDHIFAKIVRVDGTVTKFHQDLKMFIHRDRHSNSFHIGNIYIYNKDINQGYGSILMRQLLETAKRQLISYIDGYMNPAVGEYDERLKHFYKKHGFSITYGRNIIWRRNRIIVKLNV